jgi:hypothetical protein
MLGAAEILASDNTSDSKKKKKNEKKTRNIKHGDFIAIRRKKR